MGGLLEQLGDLTAAQASLREALRIQPGHALAFRGLVRLLDGRLADADLAILNDLLADSLQPDDLRSSLHYAAAQVCDARGEYDEAAQHLQAANAFQIGHFRKSGRVYDPVAHTRRVDGVIATFTPELFARFRGWGIDSERPVFIFGLPRSGTTLIEQILASHSRVYGAGEIGLGRVAFKSLPAAGQGEQAALASLESISADAFEQIAKQLLSRLQALNASAARVIDKMPDNYLHLGLLAALFPHARFIHCQRDVRDVAVSCWLTGFDKLRWANEPDHIALRIRDYQRLMQHWRKVLPVPILEVSYEAVVADLEGQARRVVAGCGLEWEPACLAFYETRRAVKTASMVQVRQPIYSRSVGRWQKYADALAPLLSQLDPTGKQKYADALAPPLPSARDMDLAWQLFQAGDFPEAESRYRTFVQAEPSRADAHNNLGQVLLKQDRLDEAATCFQRALELRPASPEVHNNLALTLERQGRPEEALGHFREALRLKPDYPDVLANMVRSC